MKERDEKRQRDRKEENKTRRGDEIATGRRERGRNGGGEDDWTDPRWWRLVCDMFVIKPVCWLTLSVKCDAISPRCVNAAVPARGGRYKRVTVCGSDGTLTWQTSR